MAVQCLCNDEEAHANSAFIPLRSIAQVYLLTGMCRLVSLLLLMYMVLLLGLQTQSTLATNTSSYL